MSLFMVSIIFLAVEDAKGEVVSKGNGLLACFGFFFLHGQWCESGFRGAPSQPLRPVKAPCFCSGILKLVDVFSSSSVLQKKLKYA